MRPDPALPTRDGVVGLQYHDAVYQADTALTGMWLFLASEMVFFGGFFLCWVYCNDQHPTAFHVATAHTHFAIGTINTVILLTSSFTFASAVRFARLGSWELAVSGVAAAMVLGLIFLALKALEWSRDIREGDVPGVAFAAAGFDAGGEQLFWILYWVGTMLHVVHLLVGVGLVGFLLSKLCNVGERGASLRTMELVGIYWSFVDMIWLVLYSLIYLTGRT